MLYPRFVAPLFLSGVMVIGADVVSGQGTSTGPGQDYPNKPVSIMTSAAGGGGDFVARLIASGISGSLRQPVIVDNRVAILAVEAVSKAPPDGYTLLVGGASIWLVPLLQKLPYDMADFSPISVTSRQINIVAVHPSLPVKSVKELITFARSRPGELNYGFTAVGGSQHLAVELLKSIAGVNILGIPYKGNAASITALISGEVQLVILDVGLLAPHVKSGRLRALAVTSAEPSALAPGLPSVSASGVPGYEAVGMTGVFAPVRTPAAIINRLNQEIVRMLKLPDVQQRFLNAGEEVVASSPEQFAATIKSDVTRMGKVIKDAGIKAE